MTRTKSVFSFLGLGVLHADTSIPNILCRQRHRIFAMPFMSGGFDCLGEGAGGGVFSLSFYFFFYLFPFTNNQHLPFLSREGRNLCSTKEIFVKHSAHHHTSALVLQPRERTSWWHSNVVDVFNSWTVDSWQHLLSPYSSLITTPTVTTVMMTTMTATTTTTALPGAFRTPCTWRSCCRASNGRADGWMDGWKSFGYGVKGVKVTEEDLRYP